MVDKLDLICELAEQGITAQRSLGPEEYYLEKDGVGYMLPVEHLENLKSQNQLNWAAIQELAEKLFKDRDEPSRPAQ